MKIMILGYSGSGKSTLARRLGEAYGCAVLHLDTLQFLPGWQNRPREEQRAILTRFLDAHDAWVIDGNYTRNCFERRLEEADQVILMLFPRLVALWRVTRRYRRYKGLSRPDMAEGCDEKLDAEFVRWVLWKGRGRSQRECWRTVLAMYPEKCVVLRSQREIDRFLLKTIHT